jgi:hypothetical protein
MFQSLGGNVDWAQIAGPDAAVKVASRPLDIRFALMLGSLPSSANVALP